MASNRSDTEETSEPLGGQYGRELELMLSGTKPLSVFSFTSEITEAEALDNQDFSSAVASKRIVRAEYSFSDSGREVRYLLFSLPGEEWRIKAYELLLEFLYTRSWSPELSWIEARIFGLSPEDCDEIVSLRLRERTDPP